MLPLSFRKFCLRSHKLQLDRSLTVLQLSPRADRDVPLPPPTADHRTLDFAATPCHAAPLSRPRSSRRSRARAAPLPRTPRCAAPLPRHNREARARAAPLPRTPRRDREPLSPRPRLRTSAAAPATTNICRRALAVYAYVTVLAVTACRDRPSI